MAPPLLIIDIGNSRLKAGLFDSSGHPKPILLQHPSDLPSWQGTPIVFMDTRRDPAWRALLEALGAEELHTGRGLPFPSRYSQRLGADRAAQLTAIYYEQRFPAMLLSLGTACVIDYFNPAGIHEGGIITAGAHLRVWALSQRTGQLPLVEPEIPSKLWGTDTPDALRAGAIHGLGLEIQGWIRSLMGNKAGLLWVSGGEAPLVKPYLPSNAIFAPDLTLRGAWLWWHYLQQGRFPS